MGQVAKRMELLVFMQSWWKMVKIVHVEELQDS